MGKPAVFIDRDGTLIEDADFLTSADQIRILPNTIPALRRLHEAGYLLVVITNQSAVARGMMTEADLEAIHAQLTEQVETLGGHIDAILYCPHLPPDHEDAPSATGRDYVTDCECRKPKPGLLLRARDELDVGLQESFAVGDAWRDVEAALAVGIPTVKLPRPPGREERPRPDLPVLAETETLTEAAEVILNTTAEQARQAVRLARTAKVKTRRAAKPKATAPLASAAKQAANPPEDAMTEPPTEQPAEPSAHDDETAETEPEFDASLDTSPELQRAAAGGDLEYETLDETADQTEEDTDEVEEEEEEEQADDEEEEETEEEEDDVDEDDEEAEEDEEEPEEDADEETPEQAVCARCGAEIDPADVTAGAAGQVHDSLLCRECFPQVSQTARRTEGESAGVTGAAGPRDLQTLCTDILTELRHLVRRQSEADEAFDLPRVLAMIAQVLAVFLAVAVPLLRGKWNPGEIAVWLLAAVFVQLFALTMFYVSRKRD